MTKVLESPIKIRVLSSSLHDFAPLFHRSCYIWSNGVGAHKKFNIKKALWNPFTGLESNAKREATVQITSQFFWYCSFYFRTDDLVFDVVVLFVFRYGSLCVCQPFATVFTMKSIRETCLIRFGEFFCSLIWGWGLASISMKGYMYVNLFFKEDIFLIKKLYIYVG